MCTGTSSAAFGMCLPVPKSERLSTVFASKPAAGIMYALLAARVHSRIFK
jgi:hypothetical protein